MRISGGTSLWLLLSCLAAKGAEVDYIRDVQPILHKHCYRCHGALRQESGLRLDHVDFMRAGGDSGPALAAASGASLLVQAVVGGGEVERMPLEAQPLSEAEIAMLRAWIDAGANAPEQPLPSDPHDHWAFQQPVRPPLPEVRRAAWNNHPIDRFLAAEHERHQLEPAEPAPRHVLLRRVYLDLIGLPPTPAELQAFLADASPDAYEKVVDQLLASPRYGERWGRHWMDIWRYSDWDGYAAEVRESQPHIWRWRDWIIESLNADKPYSAMIAEMLAADELQPDDPDALRATGFLARNWYRFNRNVWLDATVEHTSKAFLGITLNCARCHDHMYDPIAQQEYYQFRAIFEPHDVRADRVAGQSDTKLDGVVRSYDAQAESPTYVFERGNEAKPDKQHPIVPGVPRALGGGPLKPQRVPLPLAAYYPGSQDFIRREALAQAQDALARAQSSLQQSAVALAAARKQQQDLAAAKTTPPAAIAATAATGPDTATPAGAKPPASAADEVALQAAVAAAQANAALAEEAWLAAHALGADVKARIAADDAAFVSPAAANAKELAAEASRAERVTRSLSARHTLHQVEHDVAAAREVVADGAGKKNIAELEKKLTAARQTADEAQSALSQESEKYTRFSEVYPSFSTGRRTALAQWIASPRNPLTARVAINHIWLRHFGSPLVSTVFDFGRNGKSPTHPALLDWLASEWVDLGWRMKPLHRLIVTSTAYRMRSSVDHSANRSSDAENTYLWRMNSRRMEAEVVRDSTLRVADALDPTLYGPDLDPATGLTVPRRSIYFRSSKEKKVTFLDLFDRANVTDCYRRAETIVPQQALAMVNSSLSLAQARRLAGLLSAEGNRAQTSAGQRAFVDAAFERILCRAASDAERSTCLEFLASQAARLADVKVLAPFAAQDPCAVKPADDPAQRARENLVHVLLNHNDFLTIR